MTWSPAVAIRRLGLLYSATNTEILLTMRLSQTACTLDDANPHRLLRMVLLALAGNLLCKFRPTRSLVSAVRRYLRYGRVKCAVLFLAEGCDRARLGTERSRTFPLFGQ